MCCQTHAHTTHTIHLYIVDESVQASKASKASKASEENKKIPCMNHIPNPIFLVRVSLGYV